MIRYSQNPNFKTAKYGGYTYAYDAAFTQDPHVAITTQILSEAKLKILAFLRKATFLSTPKTKEEILSFLQEKGVSDEGAAFLFEDSLLVPAKSGSEVAQRRMLQFFMQSLGEDSQTEEEKTIAEKDKANFEEREVHYRFNHGLFFNLPAEVDTGQCDVGLMGIPLSTVQQSLGTQWGPAQWRLQTRGWNWFNVHAEGIYSESASHGNFPELMCQGTVIKDFGDLEFRGKTVAQVFESIDNTLTQTFFEPGIPPLLIGGDHAITYPILRSFLKVEPDLCLLHLDAHNDLFFAENVVFNHAAPISNLIRTTGLDQVMSFGLRTFSGGRAQFMKKLQAFPEAERRCQLFSVTATKQMIFNPEKLRAAFAPYRGKPFYLSIDLDVLSTSAMGGRLSTPFGEGLEWHELFYFLRIAFEELNIIGSDIVEFNPAKGSPGDHDNYYMNALLIFIIDRLGKVKRSRAQS